MTREEATLVLDHARPDTAEVDKQFYDDEDLNNALDMAIEALEFLEKYDAVWYEIKCAGEHGKEVEFHRYGRVYRIREVAT